MTARNLAAAASIMAAVALGLVLADLGVSIAALGLIEEAEVCSP